MDIASGIDPLKTAATQGGRQERSNDFMPHSTVSFLHERASW
jgi:hypothetical protein